MKRFLLCMLAALLMPTMVSAATTTATLSWDPNQEADLAGYKLYQSTSETGAFSQVQVVGTVTTTQVTGLSDGTWCWKLTAFDTAGNESGFSNTACFQSNATPPSVPSVLRVSATVVVP